MRQPAAVQTFVPFNPEMCLDFLQEAYWYRIAQPWTSTSSTSLQVQLLECWSMQFSSSMCIHWETGALALRFQTALHSKCDKNILHYFDRVGLQKWFYFQNARWKSSGENILHYFDGTKKQGGSPVFEINIGTDYLNCFLSPASKLN